MSSDLSHLYPEGWYICQSCVEWVEIKDLYTDDEGTWDVCIKCKESGRV